MSSRVGRLVFDALPARDAEICLPGVPDVSPASEPSLLGQLWQRLCSDEELAEQLQRGHADALTVLFKRHGGLLFGIARRILRNDAEAEDAVQQIFLDVFRSIAQFDPAKGAFKAWLLMFAYHRTFNLRRSQVARRFFDTDSIEDVLPGLLLPKDAKADYSVAEGGILLGQLLQTLQPRQRRTIELVYYEGLTAEEVAMRTGESVRVVRHNLYRGLERLRRSFCDVRREKTDGGAR
ncbi:sigma-70 family RNA polymerase sigma factor [Granulicella sp. dw_53]|uniref:RNA polymerase sigma factor n=1 Tax=Granulicella sp. dw_53 TaxID=2719792 RepID=UPI001BD640CC|nr:sigma-70 family RNA polymerase sigma factor [Granulicella sp. dw_53]